MRDDVNIDALNRFLNNNVCLLKPIDIANLGQRIQPYLIALWYNNLDFEVFLSVLLPRKKGLSSYLYYCADKICV